ncbi:hypothetical protein PUR29_36555, partial [Methylobacterium ajmalii]
MARAPFGFAPPWPVVPAAPDDEATPVGLAPGQMPVDPRRDGSVQPTAAGQAVSQAIGEGLARTSASAGAVVGAFTKPPAGPSSPALPFSLAPAAPQQDPWETPAGLAPGQPPVDPRRDGMVQPNTMGRAMQRAVGTKAGQVAQGLLDVTSLPGDVAAGRTDPLSDEGVRRAFDLAGTLATGGMPMAEAGAAGIFGGRLAKGADLEALKRAEGMAAGGAERRAIWDDTGWFQGPDKAWRFEIPDDASGLRRGARSEFEAPMGGVVGKAGSQFQHDGLYGAYPRAAGLRYEMWQDFPGEPHLMDGLYLGQKGGIWGRAGSADSARSLTLHEMQHHVQGAEGFAGGASPQSFTRQAWADEQLAPLKADVESIAGRYPQAEDAVRSRGEIRAGLERDYGVDWRTKAPADRLDAMDEAEAVVSLTSGAHDLAAARAALDKRQRFVSNDDMAHYSVPLWQQEQYRRVAGEVEARNVQARRDMTAEQRRATPPWETQEVPDAQQIVRSAPLAALPAAAGLAGAAALAPGDTQAAPSSPTLPAIPFGPVPTAWTSGNLSDRIVGAESGGNATAKNPRSSATGAGQFIDGTWLDMVRRYRPDLAGLPRDQVLALRNDAGLSREMVGHYADENGAKLRAAGLPDTDGSRYLAHFAGPAGARAVLSADPS